jgi:serine/threonine-protein kinase
MIPAVLACPHCGANVERHDRFCGSCGSNLERDDPSSPTDPLLGRTVGGAYVIQELIGVGGMGRVYRGMQTALGRTVAVKVIHPHLLGDEQTVARFYNEAKAASRLNHPDSVGVIDFGRSDDGILYLVMEFLTGKDLATINAEEGPLPFKRIIRILRKVAGALGEAHALGVVHRDLKPENVIVQRSRRGEDLIKVVDFGLATITGPQKTSITQPGLVCGTPDYMSPEQGRGDPLDGRTDLYSMGVLLFELLADRLPFVDDTPTKVVLRHINDPIPDPRKVAPQRNVPDALAEVAIKALQKDPKDRFQTADELDEALKAAEAALETAEAASLRCAACGASNTRSSKFCHACGARLNESGPAVARFGGATAGGSIAPPRGSMAPPSGARTTTAPPLGRSALVGRDAELHKLLEARLEAAARATWVRIVGDPGVGKSRLLSELSARADAAADLVVSARPHPSLAPVPYHAIRTLVAALLDTEVSRLPELAKLGIIESPMARAGLDELMAPRGVPGLPGRSRAGAVGALLGVAVRVALQRSASGNVVVLVDDTHRCDALTKTALIAMISDPELYGVLLVTTTTPTSRTPSSPVLATLPLRGLELPDAQAMLTGTAPPPLSERVDRTGTANRSFLPLYVEQLASLGVMSLEDDASVPQRLADAVVARVSRLELGARRVLQTLTVLGERASLEALKALVPQGDLAPLETLLRLGLVKMIDGEVAVGHPFIRELVEASIPAEARKELHARALAAEAAQHAPLEVRAEHAFRAGEPMSAILILERMGDHALERGDPHTATVAYRRGLEVARRESIHAGDTSLDPAVVTLSRKLGEALDRSGDHAGADGVLREAMELVGPGSRERGRMLLQLGRVAVHRDRQREAVRLFGQAIEVAERTKDTRYEAEAQLELGRLRRATKELEAAVAPLERALDLFERLDDGADAVLAQTALEAAETAVRRGDLDTAGGHLLVALGRARSIGSGALLARVSAARGRIHRKTGNQAAADKLFSEAQALAAEAGDTDPMLEAGE